ncbi:MAG: ABC transporter substrate-binding protein [Butyrivibrio sp.]|jgi:peptide/nickel transport system substrate-binding protein|nr:ABC transporter substrate-binding protein [Butyrivibrio sp.]
MKRRTEKLMSILMISAITVSMMAGCGSSTSGTTASSSDSAASTAGASETAASTDSASAAASTDTADADSTPRNETLYFAGQQWGTVNDYNPMSANSNNAMVINQTDYARVLVYETLYMFNPLDGSMKGLLATGDPEWNADKTEMTVKLNPDAKWSDGTQVTADDVKYTFDSHVKYQSSTGTDYSNYIDSVEAKDATTVVFKAKLDDKGKAVNPLKVSDYLPKVYVMQKAYLQTVEKRNNNDADKIKQDPMKDLVASGPYKPYVDNDQKIVLQRDDNYWGQASSMWGKLPVPKYIAHVIYKDNAAGQVALQQGEVDVCQEFLTDVQDMWEKDNLPISTWLDDAPYGLCTLMPTAFFNTKKAGLDNVTVRKAIAMAVDYDQIIASAMSGQSPTFDKYPRSIMGPLDSEQALVDQSALKDLQWKSGDVEGAKKLLDDAGIKDTDGDGIREIDGKNLSYKAECPNGWSDWNAALEIVAAAGKNIGIDITTYFPEASTYYDDMTTGNFDICMWSSPGASVSNPWSRAMFFLSSKYADLKVNWSGNFGGYKNADAEKLLEAIPNETDQAKLKEDYTDLSKILLTDVPCFALMYRPGEFYTVNESVWTNYPQSDDGRNIPPMDCTDGYGIAALYDLQLVNQ